MSAPTPWNGPLPILFTGSFLKRTPGLGNLYVGSYAAASGGGTVFDDLVNPPSTGVTAEAASLTWAQSVGTTAGPGGYEDGSWTSYKITDLVSRNFDFVMNFYLEASIARTSEGVPIA